MLEYDEEVTLDLDEVKVLLHQLGLDRRLNWPATSAAKGWRKIPANPTVNCPCSPYVRKA